MYRMKSGNEQDISNEVFNIPFLNPVNPVILSKNEFKILSKEISCDKCVSWLYEQNLVVKKGIEK